MVLEVWIGDGRGSRIVLYERVIFIFEDIVEVRGCIFVVVLVFWLLGFF